MSEEEANQEPIPAPRPSAVKELLGRRRLALALAVLFVELAIFFLAASVPINAVTQQALQSEAKNLSSASSSLGPTNLFVYIFSHNAAIAFGEMVPVVGGLLWVVSIYTTGQIVQAVALSQGASGALYGFSLLLLPFTIVELTAYTVAVSSGVMVIDAWRQRRLRNEARVLVLEAGVVVAMLLVAAAMETVTILNPGLGVALWIPTGITVVILALVFVRAPSTPDRGPAQEAVN